MRSLYCTHHHLARVPPKHSPVAEESEASRETPAAMGGSGGGVRGLLRAEEVVLRRPLRRGALRWAMPLAGRPSASGNSWRSTDSRT